MAVEHTKVCDKLNLEMDKKLRLEKHSLYGHCFRVSGRAEASKIRNKSEYVELSTQKSGTFFTNSKLRDLSDSYREYSKNYEVKQKGLVKEIIEIVGKFIPRERETK